MAEDKENLSPYMSLSGDISERLQGCSLMGFLGPILPREMESWIEVILEIS